MPPRPYRARVTIDGRRQSLGYFATQQEADAAAQAAEAAAGVHQVAPARQFQARVQQEGRRQSLGYFSSQEEADAVSGWGSRRQCTRKKK